VQEVPVRPGDVYDQVLRDVSKCDLSHRANRDYRAECTRVNVGVGERYDAGAGETTIRAY
jgi:hypothetical protein